MVKIFYPLLSNHLLIRDFCGTAVPRNPPSLFFIDPRVCIRCCFGIISGWIPYRHPPGRAFRWMKTGFQTVIHQEGRFRGWKPGNAGADTRKAVSVDGSRKMNGQTPERAIPWMEAEKHRCRHQKGRFRGWKAENAGPDTRKVVSVDGNRKTPEQTPERPFPWMEAGV